MTRSTLWATRTKATSYWKWSGNTRFLNDGQLPFSAYHSSPGHSNPNDQWPKHWMSQGMSDQPFEALASMMLLNTPAAVTAAPAPGPGVRYDGKGISTHTLPDMNNTYQCLGRSKIWHVIYSMNKIYTSLASSQVWHRCFWQTCSMMTFPNGWCALNHQGSWSIPPRIQSFPLTKSLRLYRIA